MRSVTGWRLGLQLYVLDELIERHLPVEFCDGDVVLWAGDGCRSAAAGSGSGVVGMWSAVLRRWFELMGLVRELEGGAGADWMARLGLRSREKM